VVNCSKWCISGSGHGNWPIRARDADWDRCLCGAEGMSAQVRKKKEEIPAHSGNQEEGMDEV
jgi:hypothetical protein